MAFRYVHATLNPALSIGRLVGLFIVRYPIGSAEPVKRVGIEHVLFGLLVNGIGRFSRIRPGQHSPTLFAKFFGLLPRFLQSNERVARPRSVETLRRPFVRLIVKIEKHVTRGYNIVADGG